MISPQVDFFAQEDYVDFVADEWIDKTAEEFHAYCAEHADELADRRAQRQAKRAAAVAHVSGKAGKYSRPVTDGAPTERVAVAMDVLAAAQAAVAALAEAPFTMKTPEEVAACDAREDFGIADEYADANPDTLDACDAAYQELEAAHEEAYDALTADERENLCAPKPRGEYTPFEHYALNQRYRERKAAYAALTPDEQAAEDKTYLDGLDRADFEEYKREHPNEYAEPWADNLEDYKRVIQEEEVNREKEVTQEVRRLEIREEAQRRHRMAAVGFQTVPAGSSLKDFLDVPDEPATYRIDGLLPVGGNALLVAPAKAGKSTFLGALTESLADGTEFLGKFGINGTPTVGIVDIELDERTLRRWLRERHITNVDAVRVFSLRGRVGSFNLLDDARRAEWADELRGVDFLIVDPLRPILDKLGLDEWKDAGTFLVALDELKREAGIEEAVVAHHTGHAGERSRGDSRIVDWPDAVFTIKREDMSDPLGPRFLSAFGRDVALEEQRLEYDEVTRSLVLGTGGRASGAARAADKIVDHISTSGAPLSQRAIETWFAGSIKRDDVRSALQLAVDDGRLERAMGSRRAYEFSLSAAEKVRRAAGGFGL